MPAMSSRLNYSNDEGFTLRGPDGDLIARGSMSAVSEHVLGSKARAEAEALVARADAAAAEEREREQRTQELFADGIRSIADNITKLSRRLDAIERSRDARQELDAASEATAQLLALPKDAPDPDAPEPKASADYTAHPGGELHSIKANDPDEHQPSGGGDAHVSDPAELAHPPPSQQPIAIED